MNTTTAIDMKNLIEQGFDTRPKLATRLGVSTHSVSNRKKAVNKLNLKTNAGWAIGHELGPNARYHIIEGDSPTLRRILEGEDGYIITRTDGRNTMVEAVPGGVEIHGRLELIRQAASVIENLSDAKVSFLEKLLSKLDG